MFAASPCHVSRQEKRFAIVAEKLSAAIALLTHQEQNHIGLYAENVKEHTTDGEMGKKLQTDNNY